MKLRSLFLTIGLFIAVAILVLQRSQISRLTAELESLRQQHDQATSTEPAAPTNNSNSGPAAAQQQAELLQLRAQVTALRSRTNEIAKLQAENTRIRAALESARKNAKSGEQEEPPTEERQQAISRLNDSRLYVLGLLMHAEDNQQLMATNFEQAAPYFSKLERPPTGTNQFDIIFQGPRDGVTNPSSVILVRERQPRQAQDGGWTRAYGFLDGHSEIHKEPTANFDAWEQRHLWPSGGP